MDLAPITKDSDEEHRYEPDRDAQQCEQGPDHRQAPIVEEPRHPCLQDVARDIEGTRCPIVSGLGVTVANERNPASVQVVGP